MKGYLIIPVWLLCFVGTTVLLTIGWLLSLVKRSNISSPYFKVRSIYDGGDK